MKGRNPGNRRGRRGRRGSVILEFVLVIPVYLLLLYSVMTLGDLALTASQSHLGARMSAWTRHADIDVDIVTAGGLRRAVLKRENLQATTLEVSGSDGQRAAVGWQGIEVPAAFSFAHFNLDAPFEEGGEGLIDAILDDIGFNIEIPPYLLQQIPDIDLAGQPSFKIPSISILGDLLFGKNRILANAMLGDLTKSGGMAKADSTVPWMRRRYGYASLTYSGAADMVAATALRTRHTVIVGDGYQSCKPNAYAGGGLFGDMGDVLAKLQGRSLDLRFTSAYGADGDNPVSGSGYFLGHQFESMRMVLELAPSYPTNLWNGIF